MESIDLSETNIEYIDDFAFSGCINLKYIKFPTTEENNREEIMIDINCFQSCVNLERVELGNRIKGISEYMFAFCRNLKEIFLPDETYDICEGAFIDCKSLESIVIPGTIESIEKFAFEGCDNLKEIIILNTNVDIDPRAFNKDIVFSIQPIEIDGIHEEILVYRKDDTE